MQIFNSFEDIEKWIDDGVKSICCVKDGQRSYLLKDNTLNEI